MSAVFYLTDAAPDSGGATRLLADGQDARPGWERDHGDWALVGYSLLATAVAVALAVPLLAVWSMGIGALANAEPVQRHALIFGNTWKSCPLNIAMLSIPAFMGVLWAMKGLAPTRPVLAGAASGLLAGALGALAYSLYCPEMAAPFLGIWYLLGMLIPAVAGGVLGPWLLRW